VRNPALIEPVNRIATVFNGTSYQQRPTAIYASEMWTNTVRVQIMLDLFYHINLCNIIRVTWKDKITNIEERERTNQRRLQDIVAREDVQPAIPWIGYQLIVREEEKDRGKRGVHLCVIFYTEEGSPETWHRSLRLNE